MFWILSDSARKTVEKTDELAEVVAAVCWRKVTSHRFWAAMIAASPLGVLRTLAESTVWMCEAFQPRVGVGELRLGISDWQDRSSQICVGWPSLCSGPRAAHFGPALGNVLLGVYRAAVVGAYVVGA
jgi:hypothetical protein